MEENNLNVPVSYQIGEYGETISWVDEDRAAQEDWTLVESGLAYEIYKHKSGRISHVAYISNGYGGSMAILEGE